MVSSCLSSPPGKGKRQIAGKTKRLSTLVRPLLVVGAPAGSGGWAVDRCWVKLFTDLTVSSCSPIRVYDHCLGGSNLIVKSLCSGVAVNSVLHRHRSQRLQLKLIYYGSCTIEILFRIPNGDLIPTIPFSLVLVFLPSEFHHRSEMTAC